MASRVGRRIGRRIAGRGVGRRIGRRIAGRGVVGSRVAFAGLAVAFAGLLPACVGEPPPPAWGAALAYDVDPGSGAPAAIDLWDDMVPAEPGAGAGSGPGAGVVGGPGAGVVGGPGAGAVGGPGAGVGSGPGAGVVGGSGAGVVGGPGAGVGRGHGAGAGVAARPLAAQAGDEPRVFYMNFSDGTETITKVGPGGDDASKNESQVCGEDPFAMYTGGSGCGDRAACIKATADLVQGQWADFDVVLVTKRPADSVPYSMEMIGPMGGTCMYPMGVGGIAPLDCGNRVERNISFAFACNGRPARDCAVIVSQEEAHTFGLAHTNDRCDIMYPSVSMCATPSFTDNASSLSGSGCGTGTQNSYQTLKGVLGSWPDGARHPKDWQDCVAGPPRVRIVHPVDGDRVDPAFQVVAEVEGDCTIEKVDVHVVGGDQAPLDAEARNPPYEWDLKALQNGRDYFVQVTAHQNDTMVQVAQAAVAVHVQDVKTCTTDADCAPDGMCVGGFCKVPRPLPSGCALAPAPGRATGGRGAARAAGAPGAGALAAVAVALAMRRRRRRF